MVVDLEASVNAGIKSLTGIYAASRPIQELRQLWTLSEPEINALAAPLAACIESLPIEVVEKANRFGPFVSIAYAVYTIILPRVAMERQIVNAVRTGRITVESAGAGGGVEGNPSSGFTNDTAANGTDGINAFAGFFR